MYFCNKCFWIWSLTTQGWLLLSMYIGECKLSLHIKHCGERLLLPLGMGNLASKDRTNYVLRTTWAHMQRVRNILTIFLYVKHWMPSNGSTCSILELLNSIKAVYQSESSKERLTWKNCCVYGFRLHGYLVQKQITGGDAYCSSFAYLNYLFS